MMAPPTPSEPGRAATASGPPRLDTQSDPRDILYIYGPKWSCITWRAAGELYCAPAGSRTVRLKHNETQRDREREGMSQVLGMTVGRSPLVFILPQVVN